jgi:hypothetical protein
MKKIILTLFIAFFANYLYPFSINQKEAASLQKKGQTIKRTDILNFFTPTTKKINAHNIDLNPNKLQMAAKYTLNRLNNTNKKTFSHPYIFNKKLVSTEKVKDTLRFIIALIENDKKCNRPCRILNPKFLNKYFDFIKWSGDQQTALKNGNQIKKGGIYLTHYATFEIEGSYKQTEKYSYALYEIINKYFENDLRFKISKQNVLRGTLNQPEYKNKVKPLVWVSREGLEEALMQGTIIINMPNGEKTTFVVSKNNGFAYDKNIKDRKDQKRYWYFKQVQDQAANNDSIINFGNSIFAGDIYNIGLGKIIAIRYKNRNTNKIEMRLGVLADSGGAFINNLYQLDFYGGIFKNHGEFYNWVSPMPRNVQAYILVKK